MSTSIQSQCPLCASAATEQLLDYDQWHHYFCDCCREIEVKRIFVSDPAFTRLADFPANVRESLAKRARSLPQGEFLRVTLGDHDAQASGQMWMAVVIAKKPKA